MVMLENVMKKMTLSRRNNRQLYAANADLRNQLKASKKETKEANEALKKANEALKKVVTRHTLVVDDVMRTLQRSRNLDDESGFEPTGICVS